MKVKGHGNNGNLTTAGCLFYLKIAGLAATVTTLAGQQEMLNLLLVSGLNYYQMHGT